MAWGPKIDAAQEIDFIEEVFFVVGPLDSPSVVVQCQVTVAFRRRAFAWTVRERPHQRVRNA